MRRKRTYRRNNKRKLRKVKGCARKGYIVKRKKNIIKQTNICAHARRRKAKKKKSKVSCGHTKRKKKSYDMPLHTLGAGENFGWKQKFTRYKND